MLLLVLGIRPLLPILKYKVRNKSLICDKFLIESLTSKACNFNKKKVGPEQNRKESVKNQYGNKTDFPRLRNADFRMMRLVLFKEN